MISEYKVLVSGLKNGTTQHQYILNDKFFKDFETDLFSDCKVYVDLTLTKASTQTEILFKVSGHVILPCDLSGHLFECPLDNQYTLIVKYSDKAMEREEVEDDIIYIPQGNQEINLQQVIYDIVYLSVPNKRIDPKEEPNTKTAFFYTTNTSKQPHLSQIQEQLIKQINI